MMSRIVPIVSILVAIGLFVGYVHPTYTQRIAALTDEIGDYNKALDAAQRFKEREAELTQQRNEIPPEGLARLDAFLPEGVDNVQLLLDLTALAGRSGIHFTSFNVEAPDAATGGAAVSQDLSLNADQSAVDSMTISLSATGSYGAFRSFLANAERSLRPLDLTALTVSGSETGVYSYDMTFTIYWLR